MNMLVNIPSFFDLQRSIHRALAITIGLGLTLSLVVFLYCTYYEEPLIAEQFVVKKQTYESKEQDFVFNEVEAFDFLVPIEDAFTYHVIEKRPDSPNTAEMLALIDKKQNQSFVKNGSTIYFAYDEEKQVLNTSRYETALSGTFLLNKEGQLELKANILLPSVVQEKSIILKKGSQDLKLKSSELFKECLNPLQKAKGYPPDEMFKIYGGSIYAPLQNCYRLEIAYETEAETLFIAEKDLFVFEKGKWRKLLSNENSCFFPLLEVKSLKDQSIDLSIFDVDGKQHKKIRFEIAKAKLKPLQASELFLDARQRTQNGISCLMGKKRKILQEGDWLINTGSNWKVVHHSEELKKLINYSLNHDIIVLDKIEKDRFTGHYFDAKRTAVQKIFIPLLEEKSKKKNSLSATMGSHESKM